MPHLCSYPLPQLFVFALLSSSIGLATPAAAGVFTGTDSEILLDGSVEDDVIFGGPPALAGHATSIKRLTGVSSGEVGFHPTGDVVSKDGTRLLFHTSGRVIEGVNSAGKSQVYMLDLQTNKYTLVSGTSPTAPGDDDSRDASFSPDGTKIVFVTKADNLMPRISSNKFQVVVKDLKYGGFSVLSRKKSSGAPADGDSSEPRFSPKGNYVAFGSKAGNLIYDDYNQNSDIYILKYNGNHDDYKSLSLAAVQYSGEQFVSSYTFAISPDEQEISFSGFRSGISDPESLWLYSAKIPQKWGDKFPASNTKHISGNLVGPYNQTTCWSYGPEYSNDGKKLAYITDCGDYSIPHVYIRYESNNGPANKMVSPPLFLDRSELTKLSFSPDDTMLSYSVRDAAFSDTLIYQTFNDQFYVKELDGAESLYRISCTPVFCDTDGNGHSYNGQFSPDGTGVFFQSAASNLVPSDTAKVDLFFAKLPAGRTSSVEIINGLEGSDRLYGLLGDERLNGGEGADVLDGYAGDDILDGGAGDDVMRGGLGNDTYSVDSAADQVIELAREGVDEIQSSVSFTLPGNVEVLSLIGSSNVNATGSDGDDTLKGNAAANTLDGRSGADTMIGGSGSDVYIVDDIGDTVNEREGQGIDRVKSKISYTLPANVENLTLVGTTGKTATGNALANDLVGGVGGDRLRGLDGNDRLTGRGGADTLTGGPGRDTFVYLSPADSRPGNGTRDVIADFAADQGDIIDLSAIDADRKAQGNQAFTFIGGKPFSGRRGQLRFSNGILSADTTGDRKANFSVKVVLTGGKLTAKRIKL